MGRMKMPGRARSSGAWAGWRCRNGAGLAGWKWPGLVLDKLDENVLGWCWMGRMKMTWDEQVEGDLGWWHKDSMEIPRCPRWAGQGFPGLMAGWTGWRCLGTVACGKDGGAEGQQCISRMRMPEMVLDEQDRDGQDGAGWAGWGCPGIALGGQDGDAWG